MWASYIFSRRYLRGGGQRHERVRAREAEESADRRGDSEDAAGAVFDSEAVSYTHLTLPTIYSV